MKKLSSKIGSIPPSGIRAFFDLVLGMKDVISLGVGEPDFPTPWNICESAISSLEKGITSYTSNQGLKELRIAISQFLRKKHKLNYNPDSEILITVGVSEALDLAVRAITNPGDEIIIPAPSYVSYGAVVTLAGGKPVYIYPGKNSNFKITPDDIKKVCTKKTKAIIFNYPSNPTGVSYTKQELQKIKAVIRKKNILMLSDEIYGELSYDFKHTPWPTLGDTKSTCVYLDGFSKAYAMTGWRIGYACGPEEIIGAMTKIHQYTMLSAPTTGQIAAITAIQKGHKSVRQMRDEYNRRRRFVVNSLNKMGLKCSMPQGAFYVFPYVKSTGMDSIEFSNQLLKKYKVAVVPGTAFGPEYIDYIRISYASSMENIKEAMSKMKKFIKGIE